MTYLPMSNVTSITALQLQRSIELAPAAKRAGLSVSEMHARSIASRQELRRVRVRKAVQAIDLARERNERDCCADCGEPLGVRVRLAYDPHEMIVRCLGCGCSRG